MSQEYIDRDGQIDPEMLQKAVQEHFTKNYPESNPVTFKDTQIQRFSDLWWGLEKKATAEQKDQIGKAFMAQVLKLDEKVIAKFIETKDHRTWHTVGKKQSSITEDIETLDFWNEVGKIFPELHSKSDIDFLSGEEDVYLVFHFMDQLDPILHEESPVIRKLNSNAHVYK